jgi:hypothetical protein
MTLSPLPVPAMMDALLRSRLQFAWVAMHTSFFRRARWDSRPASPYSKARTSSTAGRFFLRLSQFWLRLTPSMKSIRTLRGDRCSHFRMRDGSSSGGSVNAKTSTMIARTRAVSR